PSASTSTCTTKIPGPSFGPKQPTKSWPASLVTRSAQPLPNLLNLCHESLGRETRYLCSVRATAHTPVKSPPGCDRIKASLLANRYEERHVRPLFLSGGATLGRKVFLFYRPQQGLTFENQFGGATNFWNHSVYSSRAC